MKKSLYIILIFLSISLYSEGFITVNVNSDKPVNIYRIETIDLSIPGETLSSPVDVNIREIDFLTEAPGSFELPKGSHILLIGDLKDWNDVVSIKGDKSEYLLNIQAPGRMQGFLIGGFAASSLVFVSTLTSIILAESVSPAELITAGVSGTLSVGTLALWILQLPKVELE